MKNDKEAAEDLGLSVHTLRGWRVKGEGPEFTKCGGAVRYAPEQLEKYKQERARASTSGTRKGIDTRKRSQPTPACA
jgi:predicted site-specific integrase-resolvase